MPDVRSINLVEKTEGLQIGFIAEVEFESYEKINYYVKSHRNGVNQDYYSLVSRPVDMFEVLVYKILHLAGIGPQPLFIFADMRDFYIATKDAGYDDNTRTQKKFITYKKVLEIYPSLLQSPIARKGIIKADILSQVMRMTDVLNNPNNIGFVMENNQLSFFKIIDFSPCSGSCNSEDLKIWMKGYSEFEIEDQTILTILKRGDIIEKSLEAEECFNELVDMPRWTIEASEYVLQTTGKSPNQRSINFICTAWNCLYSAFTSHLYNIKKTGIENIDTDSWSDSWSDD